MRRRPSLIAPARSRPGPGRRTRSPRRLVRQHEADRPLLLLEQVRDQARRAREDRHALQREQRDSRHRAARRESRPRRSSRAACRHLGQQRARRRRADLDVPAGETRLRSRRRTGAATRGSCPCAAGGRSRGSRGAPRRARRARRARRLRGRRVRARERPRRRAGPPPRRSRESPSRSRGCRPPPRPAAPRAPRPASCGWPARSARGRARRSRPASRRARAAARAGQLAGHQQPDVIGEADLADQLRAQVAAAHEDRLGVRGADRRAATDPVRRSSFFVYRNKVRHANIVLLTAQCCQESRPRVPVFRIPK